MVTPAMLILHLAIAIAIILVCIIVLKLNASIGMVLACLYMGGMGGLGLMDTVSTISSGFGNMMTGIGLPIGFGVILGQLLNDSGAAGVIADKIVSAFPEKRAMWAISLAGFVLSIPVFFDVTFVILIPIGITIAAKISKKMCYVTGCLTIGATTAHCVVPPTPNPLAAADIFGFDLGVMMGVGLVVGLITVLLSDFVFIKIHDRGIWNEEKDVNHSSNVVTELLESAKRDAAADRPRPSFAMSLLPIVIPIVCILAGTVGTALFEESPVICRFLGEKVIAMLLGTLGAYLVSIRFIGRENFEKSAGEALKSAGVVLLITGAGGSFSSVIAATGIGDSIVSLLSTGQLRGSGHVPLLSDRYDLPGGPRLRHSGGHDLHDHHGHRGPRHRLSSRVAGLGLPLRRQLHRPCERLRLLGGHQYVWPHHHRRTKDLHPGLLHFLRVHFPAGADWCAGDSAVSETFRGFGRGLRSETIC